MFKKEFLIFLILIFFFLGFECKSQHKSESKSQMPNIKQWYTHGSKCKEVCKKLHGVSCGINIKNCCFVGKCFFKITGYYCHGYKKDWELDKYGCT